MFGTLAAHPGDAPRKSELRAVVIDMRVCESIDTSYVWFGVDYGVDYVESGVDYGGLCWG